MQRLDPVSLAARVVLAYEQVRSALLHCTFGSAAADCAMHLGDQDVCCNISKTYC